MKVQAAKIKINGSHRGDLVVAHYGFGMDKARSLLIDSDSRLDQLLVAGAGSHMH